MSEGKSLTQQAETPSADEDRIITCDTCGGVKTYIIQIKSIPFDGWIRLKMPVKRCYCGDNQHG